MNRQRVILLIILTGCCFSGWAQKKFPVRDALMLQKFYENGLLKNDANNTVANVLISYAPKNVQDDPSLLKSVFNKKNDGTDPNPFIEIAGTTESLTDLTGFGAVARRVGGANVTNIADGLAKFLVERTKEELSIAFFNQFKEDMNNEKYSDLHILFPQTKLILETIDEKIYQFSAYLSDLRDAFIIDLNNLPHNFPAVVDQEKYNNYFKDHPQFKSLLKLASLTGDVLLKKYAKLYHPGKLIDSVIDIDHYFNLATSHSALDTNINASVKTLQLLSRSLQSADTSRYWVNTDSLVMLVSDSIAFKIYLGLIYTESDGIIFSGNKKLTTILTEHLSDAAPIKKSLVSLGNFIRKVDRNFNLVKDVESGTINDSLSRYFFPLYSAALDLVQNGVTLAKSWDSNLALKIGDIEQYTSTFKLLGDVYLEVRQKKYSLAILSLINLTDTVLNAAYLHINSPVKLTKVLRKLSLYGTFIASVAKAESSDEVKEILDRTVLPTGSSSIKKQSRFNIALNAYTGLYYGQQRQATDKDFVSVAGVYAPVGIAASWGIPGNKKGGNSWSISLFASIIDVGPLVAYRFSNYNDTLANDVNIRLGQIVSPGGHLIIGLPKVPVSIGGGFNWSPLITKVEKESLTTQPNDKRPFRWQVFIAVDIPFFNFYNKPR
jgi:hypothetical protein